MSASPELRLATRRNGLRDGELMLVSPDARHWMAAGADVPTLQRLLDDWDRHAPELAQHCVALHRNGWAGAQDFDAAQCMAPLPRAYQWADASVYRNHARLMYPWRKEPIPPGCETVPLVYQGGSDVLLGPRDPIEAMDEAYQIDLEAEIGVVTTDVPMGCTAQQARACIALVVLLNDVSLRGLIPGELAKGFGFYQSKPASSFAPIAVTPAALGSHWAGAMLDLPVSVQVNGHRLGEPHANTEVIFDFGQIIAHLARTRSLCAGSIVGAGAISNASAADGSACITEARVRQILDGVPEDGLQPYLRDGDTVRMEVCDVRGRTVFGAIDQSVSIRAPG
jgi:fumarylacetoacetate (FAA) hydrolase